ncbi:hypothetical protein RMSM_02076 [Rhodopirellula maiorica SM1]|uniref:Uncharacterized protein n=1 Tax=Rhodopirellula maiorica SM1 TaxID=1265738 RepID=M5S474_9BACT|nr:hypothetical protein RMSM_02076 [Rhodopirellula maiorica SM1]
MSPGRTKATAEHPQSPTRQEGWPTTVSRKQGQRPRTLSFPENNSTFGQIVGRQFDSHLITRDNTDEVFTHSARNMSHYFAAGLELDAETSIGECLGYRAFDFEGLFFLCQETKPVSFEGIRWIYNSRKWHRFHWEHKPITGKPFLQTLTFPAGIMNREQTNPPSWRESNFPMNGDAYFVPQFSFEKEQRFNAC